MMVRGSSGNSVHCSHRLPFSTLSPGAAEPERPFLPPACGVVAMPTVTAGAEQQSGFWPKIPRGLILTSSSKWLIAGTQTAYAAVLVLILLGPQWPVVTAWGQDESSKIWALS